MKGISLIHIRGLRLIYCEHQKRKHNITSETVNSLNDIYSAEKCLQAGK